MKPWNILVTGSSGLIGSEAVKYFDRQGHRVVGADNNMRRVFFGPPGDTLWNLERLKNSTKKFTPVGLDIRDREGVMALFREHRFDLIVHCAAQPIAANKFYLRARKNMLPIPQPEHTVRQWKTGL